MYQCPVGTLTGGALHSFSPIDCPLTLEFTLQGSCNDPSLPLPLPQSPQLTPPTSPMLQCCCTTLINIGSTPVTCSGLHMLGDGRDHSWSQSCHIFCSLMWQKASRCRGWHMAFPLHQFRFFNIPVGSMSNTSAFHNILHSLQWTQQVAFLGTLA